MKKNGKTRHMVHAIPKILNLGKLKINIGSTFGR
jgi:hypothetical protein